MFDCGEDEVEKIASEVADAAVGVGEVEDEIGPPRCEVAVGGEGSFVEGGDEVGGEPGLDEGFAGGEESIIVCVGVAATATIGMVHSIVVGEQVEGYEGENDGDRHGTR